MIFAKKQEEKAVAPRPKKSKPVKRGVAVLLLCALAGGGFYIYFGRSRRPSADFTDMTYTTAAVERRSITAAITGSGTLQAANTYSVTTNLSDTILTADFEEGDRVEMGQILYTIDSSDMATTLEQSAISLSQAERSYQNKLESKNDLNVTATLSGRIMALNVEVGDEVSPGQTIATIRNSDTMTLTAPFPADDAEGFYVGQAAQVTLDSTFEPLSGTVSKISANTSVRTGNMIVREVTIDVANPGGISTTQSASAQVNGVGSSAGGAFTYKEEGTVTAGLSGQVAGVNVSEGDWVEKGRLLVTLTSDSLDDEITNASNSLRNAQISQESQYNRLEDYTITSPISGTVIDKNYKAGETSEANKTLCTIYDLSYLQMTLNVDELDIADIAVGQTVSVVADALEDRTYEGVVTKVSVVGSTSGGVTTYPVSIRIDETDGLLPGMNVDATILFGSAENVLTIPAAALNRGNRVLITADSPSAKNASAAEGSGQGGTPGEGDAMPDFGGSAPEGSGDRPNISKNGEGQNTSAQGDVAGYVSVEVEIGLSDDNYIEIVSGLQEGDTVAYIPTASSGGFGMMMGMGGMPGGMGGGMPSGGPGGRPGGF